MGRHLLGQLADAARDAGIQRGPALQGRVGLGSGTAVWVMGAMVALWALGSVEYYSLAQAAVAFGVVVGVAGLGWWVALGWTGGIGYTRSLKSLF